MRRLSLDNISEINADHIDVGDSDIIDKLLSEASAAIDSGNYITALDGFRLALELTRQIFGEQAELSELEEAIAELNELLGE